MLEKLKAFLFENTTTRQTVAKNTFWLAFGTFSGRIIRTALIIYAARILGTEGYGIFSYATSAAAFFTIFTDIGLSGLLTRELARGSEQVKPMFSTIFMMKLGVLAITLGLMLFGMPYVTKIEAARPLIPIVSLLLIFDSFRAFGFSVARGESRMEIEGKLSIFTDFMITVLGVGAIAVFPDPRNLAVFYTLGSALGTLVTVWTLRAVFGYGLRYFDKNLVRPIFSAAWPFAVMGLLGGFMINVDIIIIGWFRSAHELGLYSAAQRPIQFLYLIPVVIASGVFPVISRFAHLGDQVKSRLTLEKSLAALFLVAIPLTVGGVVLGEEIVVLLFGEAYRGATLAFQLLMTTMLTVFPGSAIGNTIFAYDKQHLAVVATAAGALGNTVLDLLLIPAYGIAGSAAATVVAQALVTGFNWRRMHIINPFSVMPHLKYTLLATVLMALATFALKSLGIPVALNVILSAMLYGILLLAFKEPVLGDLRAVLK